MHHVASLHTRLRQPVAGWKSPRNDHSSTVLCRSLKGGAGNKRPIFLLQKLGSLWPMQGLSSKKMPHPAQCGLYQASRL